MGGCESRRELPDVDLHDDGIRGSAIRIPWEDGGAGELFPHIYGAIDTTFVVAVRPAAFDGEGVLRY